MKRRNIQARSKYPPHVISNPLYSYFWYSVREDDQNEVIICFGRPGSCKSSWALKLMQDLDIGWNKYRQKWVSRAKFTHIVYSVQDLFKLATSYLPEGTIIIYDEAGVESDNSSYHETRAQLLRWVLQTWRYKNIILVVTLPSLRSLTIGIRRLATVYVETYGRRQRDKNHAWARITMVSHKGRGDKEVEYQKFLRFKDITDDGVKVTKKMRWYKFARPNKILEWKYKRIKTKQTEEWYKMFGTKKLSEDMDFMTSLLGNKAKNKNNTIKEAEDIYKLYRDKISEFTVGKGKLVRGLLEKKLHDDGKYVSEDAMKKAFAWMKGDVETINFLSVEGDTRKTK